MPRFADSTETPAPPEEVWKLLYDPSRFPDWWAGIETIEPGADGGYTMFLDGYPDFPMPQRLETHRDDNSVRISCLVSDLHYEWRLEELGDGGTRISVDVEIPEREGHRLETQRGVIARALRGLAALASA